jgi:hypothetical protein
MPTSTPRRLVVCFLLLTAGCTPFSVTTQVGLARTKVGGDLALDSTSAGLGAITQDVDSAFGLGSGQDSPFLRAEVQLGGPMFSASVFWLEEEGNGELQRSFGGLSANTQVASNLELTVGKLTAAYGIQLGPVLVAPGLMVDVVDLKFDAREQTLGARETVDEVLALPLPCLRVQGDVGDFRAFVEAGYLYLPDLSGRSAQFLDLEAQVQWTVAGPLHLFVGYRLLTIDANGDADDQTFSADLAVQGFMVGGGVRF